MIADSIRNKALYAGISQGLALALDFVEKQKVAGFTEHTVELDGRQVYAMYQSYVTEFTEGRQYEAHRRYIDVQYIVEGEEVIRTADLAGLTGMSGYDEDKDVQWFMPEAADTSSGNTEAVNIIHLKAGQFGVFFPQDAHMPKLAAGSPCAVKKIVVKVAV
jgi:YhcH/YjgK/YiaL family protein